MHFAGLVISTLPETTQQGFHEYPPPAPRHPVTQHLRFWGHFCLGIGANSGSHGRILYGCDVHTTKASSPWVSSCIHPYFVALYFTPGKDLTFGINRLNVLACSFKQISFPTFFLLWNPTISVRRTLLNGLLAVPSEDGKKREQQNRVPSVLAALLSLLIAAGVFPLSLDLPCLGSNFAWGWAGSGLLQCLLRLFFSWCNF